MRGNRRAHWPLRTVASPFGTAGKYIYKSALSGEAMGRRTFGPCPKYIGGSAGRSIWVPPRARPRRRSDDAGAERTDRPTERQGDRPSDRPTGRPTDQPTDRPTARPPERETRPLRIESGRCGARGVPRHRARRGGPDPKAEAAASGVPPMARRGGGER